MKREPREVFRLRDKVFLIKMLKYLQMISSLWTAYEIIKNN